jgi:CheY-like chemotaxis protein
MIRNALRPARPCNCSESNIEPQSVQRPRRMEDGGYPARLKVPCTAAFRSVDFYRAVVGMASLLKEGKMNETDNPALPGSEPGRTRASMPIGRGPGNQDQPDRSPGAERVEVLVVEDSPTQAELLRHLLEQHGHRVTVANTGEQALALLGECAPAVVISDIVMPGMSGFDLCWRIKADERTQHIPVILLTSLSSPDDALEGLACGADSFVTKPYTEEYVLANIQQVLGSRQPVSKERARIGFEIQIAGKARFITADQPQMLTLLISTYQAAAHRNAELIKSRDQLSALNARLEDLVEERTSALAAEIAAHKLAKDELIRH